jgi:hypothetical protein
MESYFQDQTLVVRPTKMYDFSQANPAAFKTPVQWYMGKPTGNTTQTP